METKKGKQKKGQQKKGNKKRATKKGQQKKGQQKHHFTAFILSLHIQSRHRNYNSTYNTINCDDKSDTKGAQLLDNDYDNYYKFYDYNRAYKI